MEHSLCHYLCFLDGTGFPASVYEGCHLFLDCSSVCVSQFHLVVFTGKTAELSLCIRHCKLSLAEGPQRITCMWLNLPVVSGTSPCLSVTYERLTVQMFVMPTDCNWESVLYIQSLKLQNYLNNCTIEPFGWGVNVSVAKYIQNSNVRGHMHLSPWRCICWAVGGRMSGHPGM